jgi:Cu+-exporting ATPase
MTSRGNEKGIATCYHCGEDCVEQELKVDNRSFCCVGCETVYGILNENDLCNYYELENTPGISPPRNQDKKFEFLDHQNLLDELIDFKDEKVSLVTFHLPQIHCSSCIWLLENLYKLNPHIISSRVNLPKKNRVAPILGSNNTQVIKSTSQYPFGILTKPTIQ